jgi:PiT family inorganic phosphate transporter
MIDIHIVTFSVIFGGLAGAIIWDLITWYYGLPTSSSHALVGGYAGAAVAKAGFAALVPSGWTKTIIFIFLSPLIGMTAGFLLMVAIQWIFRWMPPSRVDRWFRRLQLLSAAFFSLNHGANDAQKTMGIVAGVLFTAGYIQTFYIPFWVVLIAHTAIGLGTLAGGWRIIHTMGSKITKLQPVGGFAAETGAAISLLIATQTGVPVSTTHAITGAIVGVGATRRLSAVRWGVARRIVWAWVLTIPAAFLIAAGTYTLLRLAGAR